MTYNIEPYLNKHNLLNDKAIDIISTAASNCEHLK